MLWCVFFSWLYVIFSAIPAIRAFLNLNSALFNFRNTKKIITLGNEPLRQIVCFKADFVILYEWISRFIGACLKHLALKNIWIDDINDFHINWSVFFGCVAARYIPDMPRKKSVGLLVKKNATKRESILLCNMITHVLLEIIALICCINDVEEKWVLADWRV